MLCNLRYFLGKSQIYIYFFFCFLHVFIKGQLYYVILINILLFMNWWSYESDRHTCHTKISMTQGLTAKFCVNLLSINSTI